MSANGRNVRCCTNWILSEAKDLRGIPHFVRDQFGQTSCFQQLVASLRLLRSALRARNGNYHKLLGRLLRLTQKFPCGLKI